MSRSVKLVVDLTVTDDAPIVEGRYAGAQGATLAEEFLEALHVAYPLLPDWIETIDGTDTEAIS